jgi:hypothetical protein
MPIISGGGGGGAAGGFTQSYIGYNTVGGSFETVAAGAAASYFKTVTLASAGLLVSIDAHVKSGGANVQNLLAAVLDDNAGAPGKVIAMGTVNGNTAINQFNVTMSTVARWVAMPVGAYLQPAAYWLCVIIGNNCLLAFDATGADKKTAISQTWLLEADVRSATINTYSIRGSVLR